MQRTFTGDIAGLEPGTVFRVITRYWIRPGRDKVVTEVFEVTRNPIGLVYAIPSDGTPTLEFETDRDTERAPLTSR